MHKAVWLRMDEAVVAKVRPFLRYGVVVAQQVVQERCALQASALTYLSLISMVPLLAMMFAVSKGLNAHDKLMAVVNSKLETMPPGTAEFAQKVFQAVDNTNFGTLGLVGLCIVFWSAISMLGQVESTINDIWHIKLQRSWVRRLQMYVTVMVSVPLFFLVATSASTMLSSQRVTQFLQANLGAFYGLFQTSLWLLAVGLVVAAFTLLYLTMPNTPVRFASALLGGGVGGIAWSVTQFAYLHFQLGIFQAGGEGNAMQFKIYGAFAIIPLFLAWLYLNWMIVLVGGVCGYVFQNRDTLLRPGRAGTLSFAARLQLSLVMVYEAVAASARVGQPWSATRFAQDAQLRQPDVADCLRILAKANILAELADRPGCYLPVRAGDQLTPVEVERALREDTPEQPSRSFIWAAAGDQDKPLGNLRPADYRVCRLYDERFHAFSAGLAESDFLRLARRRS